MRLARDEATSVLTSHPLLAGLTPVKTLSTSKGDHEAEAKARVHIAGAALNVKFLRYDDGWRWESAHWHGDWVSAELVAAELREDLRVKQAREWAESHRDEYRATILSLNGFSESLPRRPQAAFTYESWANLRTFSEEVLRSNSAQRTPVQLAEFLLQHLGSAHDAWGHELLYHFDSFTRAATFRSVGPDGQRDTPDDVVTVVQGRREWDDFYKEVMFNYYKSWSVPEGMEDLAQPFTGTDETVVTTRVFETFQAKSR